jgi:DNA mismatch endonuclease, patch repair protein
MSRIGGKDTLPERIVRRLLHRLGYRFRVHRRDLPGTPDIVLPGRRKVIFVHGCFWHGHGCKIGKPPKSRLDFWSPKVERTRQRDASRELALANAGWDVLTVWQCEIRKPNELREHLVNFLGPPGAQKKPIDTEEDDR